MCVAGEVGWCLQTLLSSAHVDDHDGHPDFCAWSALASGEPLCGPEPIDGLLGRPLHCVAQQKVQAPDTNTDSQNRSRLLWSLISRL